MNTPKIAIICEEKLPPDARVPLSPQQCAHIIEKYDLDIRIEPSDIRCYKNEEYLDEGVRVTEKVEDADLLLGVKEVPIDKLIPGKTYCFFSHTIKEQPYNRDLLRAVLAKDIRLIDYEVLTDDRGRRLIAFGRFAGMVGAHNALWTWGRRTGDFELPRMKDCFDYAEAKSHYQKLHLPPLHIVLTGTGRVGHGAAEVLRDMGIRQLSPEEFLMGTYREAVFTQLSPEEYVATKNGGPYDRNEFYAHPERYHIDFEAYTHKADIMINGIYWDNRAPAFFTAEEMGGDDFNIQVIADVTCDIAPESSIPSTLKASTIADPVFGFDPETGEETAPHLPQVIDMMTIDNLPSELPRDASHAFGEMFIEQVLPEFLKLESEVLERATIAHNGQLGPHFTYLHNYAKGYSKEGSPGS